MRLSFFSLSLTTWLVLAFLAMPRSVDAWTPEGHRIMGVLTEDLLDADARREADRLLALFGPAPLDLPSACAWLDWIRSRGVAHFDRWHYVNQPILAGNLPVPTPHPDDVVFAIRESLRTLEDPDASDFGRAFALRVLLHTVGDIHQPLHTATRLSPAHPEGDRGGNDFPVTGVEGVTNLHRLWDLGVGQIPGRLDDEAAARRVAEQLLGVVEADELSGRADLDPERWADEGLRLAEEVAYAGIDEGGRPSEAYLERARPVVRRQLVLASHRLAALLNQTLGESRH